MARKRTKDDDSRIRIRLKDGREILLPDGEVMDFAETLRNTIRAAGLTQYHLAKVTGIPQSALSQFMSGKDLRLATFQKLCHVVGIELAQNPDRAPRTVVPDQPS
jgi:DNA-binding Xre family transcriptional regulator